VGIGQLVLSGAFVTDSGDIIPITPTVGVTVSKTATGTYEFVSDQRWYCSSLVAVLTATGAAGAADNLSQPVVLVDSDAQTVTVVLYEEDGVPTAPVDLPDGYGFAWSWTLWTSAANSQPPSS
jgi:hypothetical protein